MCAGGWVVVHQVPEEPKRVLLWKQLRAKRALELERKRLDLIPQPKSTAVEVTFQEGEPMLRGQPGAPGGERIASGRPKVRCPGIALVAVFSDRDEIQRQAEVVAVPHVEKACTADQHLADRVRTGNRLGQRLGLLLEEVLINANVRIPETERRLVIPSDGLSLRFVEALVVDSAEHEDDSEIAALREEDMVIDEAEDVDERVHGACVVIVPDDV